MTFDDFKGDGLTDEQVQAAAENLRREIAAASVAGKARNVVAQKGILLHKHERLFGAVAIA